LYTNGDLITKQKLIKLKKAGLDEIRFNLSARGYDFRPILLAKQIFKNVTVETPAVPEEKSKIIAALNTMNKIKVSYLNLHELTRNENNNKAFNARRYTYKDLSSLVRYHRDIVLGSETTALTALKYSCDKKITVNFNYCSNIYKQRFQTRGKNTKLAPFAKEPYESITPIGSIRQISLKSPPLKWMNDFIKNNHKTKQYWQWSKTSKVLYIHSRLFNALPNNQKVYICYFDTILENWDSKKNDTEGKKVSINNTFGVRAKKIKRREIIMRNINMLRLFNLLFIKKLSVSETVKKILTKNKQGFLAKPTISYISLLKEVNNFYQAFENSEFIGTELL